MLANGFYEFYKKIPYRISYKENTFPNSTFSLEVPDFPSKLLFIAAVYDENNFVICTQRSTRELNEIHHRMPVVFSGKSEIEDWLMRKTIDFSLFQKESFGLETIKLSPFARQLSEKSIKCLMRFEEYETRYGMKKYFSQSPRKPKSTSKKPVANQSYTGQKMTTRERTQRRKTIHF